MSTGQHKYRGRVSSAAGSIEVDVIYRLRPWGIDLDDVFIANTDTKLPLTSAEYYRLTKEIAQERAFNV